MLLTLTHHKDWTSLAEPSEVLCWSFHFLNSPLSIPLNSRAPFVVVLVELHFVLLRWIPAIKPPIECGQLWTWSTFPNITFDLGTAFAHINNTSFLVTCDFTDIRLDQIYFWKSVDDGSIRVITVTTGYNLNIWVMLRTVSAKAPIRTYDARIWIHSQIEVTVEKPKSRWEHHSCRWIARWGYQSSQYPAQGELA